MRRTKSSCLVIILLVLSSAFAEAQTVAQLIKAGDKKFEEGAYYEASLYYKSSDSKYSSKNPNRKSENSR